MLLYKIWSANRTKNVFVAIEQENDDHLFNALIIKRKM